MKPSLIVVIISICLSVIGLVVAGVTYKHNALSEYDTEERCINAKENVCGDDKKCCILWDDAVSVCRKSHMKNGKCESVNNTVAFFFGIIGLVFVIVLSIALTMVLVEYFTGQKTTFEMTNSVYRFS
jgi:hypothetical protein